LEADAEESKGTTEQNGYDGVRFHGTTTAEHAETPEKVQPADSPVVARLVADTSGGKVKVLIR
jgi:hypothetical protein